MHYIKKQKLTLNIEKIIPYENNPRKNDNAVNDVKQSIIECGYNNLIEIDENNIILSGHTRLKALRVLNYKDVEVIKITGLNEEQKRKYRILANKTAEIALWDNDLLLEELNGLDFSNYDFNFDMFSDDEEPEEQKENVYTKKITIPTYEPTGDKPDITSLIDETKVNQLIQNINNSSLSQSEKEFLIKGAYRHFKFNYKNIAEFYCHSSREVQELMEQSALVIIDFEKAIEYGYVKAVSEIEELFLENDD